MGHTAGSLSPEPVPGQKQLPARFLPCVSAQYPIIDEHCKHYTQYHLLTLHQSGSTLIAMLQSNSTLSFAYVYLGLGFPPVLMTTGSLFSSRWSKRLMVKDLRSCPLHLISMVLFLYSEENLERFLNQIP